MATIRSMVGALVAALALGQAARADEPKAYTLKELQSLHTDILKAEGFKPEVEREGLLKVVTGGRTYYFFMYVKNPRYFVINSLSPPPASGDPKAMAVLGNRVMTETTGVKFFLDKRNIHVLESANFVANVESVKTVLPVAFADLIDARVKFDALIDKLPPAAPAKTADPPAGAKKAADALAAVKKEAESLATRWTVEKVIEDGKVDGLVGNLLTWTATISAGNGTDISWSFSNGGGKTKFCTVVLDPSKTPKTIDLIGPGEKEITRGVYTLDGKTLTIAFAAPGADRPAKVESVKGSKVELWVLKSE